MPKMNASNQLTAGCGLEPSSGAHLATAKEEIKTHFITREGVYKQMTLSEYSRPNRVPLNQGSNNVCNAPVRVSFLSVQCPSSSSQARQALEGLLINGDAPLVDDQRRVADSPTNSVSDLSTSNDRICFNIGRELYVFVYRGVSSAVDLNKPVDKRVYKGTYPTSHDFNQETATSTSCNLIIGFSAGQIQLIDPFQKDVQISRLFNEDRLIDKTAVTCLKWIPGHPNCFIASHASGNAYVYNEELPCNSSLPLYQVHKQGEDYTIFTCKSKTPRNPQYRWAIGNGAIHEFAFSSSGDSKLFATVSQDGFLRVFNYQTMELITQMKSYFGGLLCLAWSPDAKYVVAGGEDDLITVYCVSEKRVLCRGQGHRSWISKVAFDPYTSYGTDYHFGVSEDLGSDEDLLPSSVSSTGLYYCKPGGTAAGASGGRLAAAAAAQPNLSTTRSQKESISSLSAGGAGYHSNLGVSYRIGSVGHDTQLCLWDLTEDVLKKQTPFSQKHRASTIIVVDQNASSGSAQPPAPSRSSCGSGKERRIGREKKHKRGFSFAAKFSSNPPDRWNGHSSPLKAEKPGNESAAGVLLGTSICPRMDEVSIIEPLVCKKIAHERLTGLIFREDCIVTACQEGFILTWARPGKAAASLRNAVSSPPISVDGKSSGTIV